MTKTTLILGAGFSMPYGYPSGKKLIRQIGNTYNKVGDTTLERLKTTINETQIESIDSFLNEHQEFYDLGKQLIGQILLKAEIGYLNLDLSDENTYYDYESRDIIKHILNNLNEEDFDKFNIITFNYDRHLEWSLYNKLKHKYKDEKKAIEAMAKLKIIHVHGKMIPFSKYGYDGKELSKFEWVPYGLDSRHVSGTDIRNPDEYTTAYTTHAKNHIKTIFTNDEISEDIKQLIQASKRVFFLGFGYDEKNMKLLGITPENAKLKKPYSWTQKVVSGTAQGLEPIDKNKITRLFPFLGKLALKNKNCKTFFLEEFSLTNPEDDDSDNKKGVTVSCCEMNANQEFVPPAENHVIGLHYQFTCKTCEKVRSGKFSKVGENWLLNSTIN